MAEEDPRVVTIVSNNDGGHGAIVHADLAAAKAWARTWALGPDVHPTLTEEQRRRIEQEIEEIDLTYCDVEGARSIDAWKEWIYFARVWRGDNPLKGDGDGGSGQ